MEELFLLHCGSIGFFVLENGYANGFVIEQEEKENPLSLPVQGHIFDAPTISISVCLDKFLCSEFCNECVKIKQKSENI